MEPKFKKKSQKELQADFASLSALKDFAECQLSQLRKSAGTGVQNVEKAAEYLKNVEIALRECGAKLK